MYQVQVGDTIFSRHQNQLRGNPAAFLSNSPAQEDLRIPSLQMYEVPQIIQDLPGTHQVFPEIIQPVNGPNVGNPPEEAPPAVVPEVPPIRRSQRVHRPPKRFEEFSGLGSTK